MPKSFNYKKKLTPTKWFFFDLNSKKNQEILYSLSKEVGVVFFCNSESKNYSFFKRIQPFIKYCQKKGVKFIIPISNHWANRYKAFGILIQDSDIETKNFKLMRSLKKKYHVACKIHCIKEVIKFKSISDIVFISPVFSTTSYPNREPLKNYIFLYLCHLLKRKWIFLLGGMNEKNFELKKFNLISGFGAISSFKNGNARL